MKKIFPLVQLLLIFSISLLAQDGPHGNGVQIVTDEPEQPKDSAVVTRVVHQGGQYDTAIFDSTKKVLFRIHENRGDEMIHSWISLGCPLAPHIYLGAGVYHFDKAGMSDLQFGWYPLQYPHYWESYFAFERMFFLRRKSKEVEVPICMAEGAANGLRVHYNYAAKLRRDKFYGITSGIGYEGWLNPQHKTMEMYHVVDVTGENHSILLERYVQVNVHAGLSRMRCKNVEYEAPEKFRKKRMCRASTMTRMTLGGMYYPVKKLSIQMDTGFIVDFMQRATQPDFAVYFSWEGRVAFLNMKHEWGVHANMVFITPSWNRFTDHPIAIICTWGVYVSLDRKVPAWKSKVPPVDPYGH